MRSSIRKFGLLLATATLMIPATMFAANGYSQPVTDLNKAVRHQLVMLPYYNIFDELNYEILPNNHVVLTGAVTDPVLKKDAGNVVKRIEGVEGVTNNIEVLPLSPFDNRIRLAEYRAIYGYGPLQRYRLGALPPIHIIVKNGHVTLTGFVANEGDRNIANIRANMVPGVFSVTNDLQVDRRG